MGKLTLRTLFLAAAVFIAFFSNQFYKQTSVNNERFISFFNYTLTKAVRDEEIQDSDIPLKTIPLVYEINSDAKDINRQFCRMSTTSTTSKCSFISIWPSPFESSEMTRNIPTVI